METSNKILEKLESIERATLLGSKDMFTVADLALWLGLSEKTIRNQLNSIPHIKHGSRVWFEKAKIIEWQKSGIEHVPHYVEGNIDRILFV